MSDWTPTLSGLLSNYACPILQIQDFLVAVSRIWYQNNMGVNRHTMRHFWPHVDGLAASAGARMRAIEPEISAALWAKWLRKDFYF